MTNGGLAASIDAISSDAIEKFLGGVHVVGLGSGSTVARLVAAMSRLSNKSSISCIPTSLQIKVEAEKSGLILIGEPSAVGLDIVFDGADQIDSRFNMIKGGGGALLREKILIAAAKRVVIMADETKFVKTLNRSVPIEVHPFARSVVEDKLKSMGGKPSLRLLEKGYPFVTENGNIIIDTSFGEIKDPNALESKIKSLAGVLEVGIFTRGPDVLYLAKSNGEFEMRTKPSADRSQI